MWNPLSAGRGKQPPHHGRLWPRACPRPTLPADGDTQLRVLTEVVRAHRPCFPAKRNVKVS